MERLIADANKVKKANGEMADLSIDSFADVTEAIHIMQKEMKISGATAEEAKTTISGSLSSMKAAWKNLVVGIADENANFEELVDNFVDSAGIAAGNLLPRIEQALVGVGKLIEGLFPVIMERIPQIITETLPQIAESGMAILQSLMEGISQNSDGIMETVLSVLGMFVTFVVESLPMIIETGFNMLVAFLNGLAEHPDEIIQTAIDIVLNIISGLLEGLPKLIKAAGHLVAEFLLAIFRKYPDMVKAGFKTIQKIIEGIRSSFEAIVNAGKEVVEKIKEGIAVAWENLKNWFNSLWDGLFGHRSFTVNATGSGDGSHAGGLAYVPFDDYKATLHKGERVLTAEEADEYESGTKGGRIQIIQNIYSEAKTAADLMQEAMYEQERAVLLGGRS